MPTSISSITVTCVLLITVLTACSPSDDQGEAAAQGSTTLQSSSTSSLAWNQSTPVASNQIGHAELQCPDESEVQAARVITFVCDRSGSVKDHPQVLIKMKHEMAMIVRKAPTATAVWVQYASDNSLAVGERIPLGTVPDPGKRPPCTAGDFDPYGKRECRTQRKAYEQQVACATLAKENILTKIRNLQPQIAQTTDFWGAIRGAEEVFHAYPMAEKALVVYSDAKDTIHLKLPKNLPGLKDAAVVLRLIREGQLKGKNGLLAETTRVQHITSKFEGWGTKPVETTLIDIPFTKNIFPNLPTRS